MSSFENTPELAADIIVSGPSASGKSTLIERARREFEGKIGLSVSHTTRPRRESERNGIDYHFVTREEFTDLINGDQFLQTSTHCDNMYGTSKEALNDVRSDGKVCILDVLARTALKLRGTLKCPTLLVFIKPPSHEVLEKRLRDRGNDTEENIKKRLRAAVKELEYEPYFDRVIINDDLETAYKEFRELVAVEVHKISGNDMAR